MFDTSSITEGPVAEPDGAGTLVWWASSDPEGTLFQLYQDRRLAWHGTERLVTLPTPIGPALYQVGTVDADEGNVDFSASLPLLPGTGNRASIDWEGGYWEAPDLIGFYVYSSAVPGGAVDYDAILEDIKAYAPGLPTDGYGMGGYGSGGYGSASGHYWYTSDALANGVWTFGVKPYDSAGNLGTTQEVAVAVAGPPAPPARDATTGLRVSYTYNATTHVATLAWHASPG